VEIFKIAKIMYNQTVLQLHVECTGKVTGISVPVSTGKGTASWLWV